MRFNIYGRFQIEVRREHETWEVFRLELGKRAKVHDIVIPENLAEEEMLIYLDDIFHEYAGHGEVISLMR